jgi:predicted branched-subunit amino acid permease
MMTKKQWLVSGMRAGIPISLGYFAVSLALGLSAKNAGFTAFQATLTSFLINASAGEYIGFALISAGAGYIEVFIMEAVANARYLLMSCALSQKLEPATPMWKRLLLGYCITDEVFGVSVAVDGYVDPVFTYGAMMIAVPGWSLGTLCGAMLDDFLPIWVLSALSVCLYGMFISVFIPEARRNKIVALLVLISVAARFLFMRLPLFGGISSGIKIIILTVVMSFGAALIWPVKDGESDE